MARKEKIIQVPEWGNRDAGKIFLIKEWPAARAEKWAIRALLAYTRNSNVQIPMNMASAGWEGLAVLGINALLAGGMQASEIIPILDELLECVTIIRDPKAKDVTTNKPVAHPIMEGEDIAEIITRGWLRSEVFELHSGFSPAAALSMWFSTMERRQTSENIQTSPPNLQ